LEILIGFLVASVARGLIVGFGVYFIALIFTTATMQHLILFLLYSIAVSIIFSLVAGMMCSKRMILSEFLLGWYVLWNAMFDGTRRITVCRGR